MVNFFPAPSSATHLSEKKRGGFLKRGSIVIGAVIALCTLTACGGTSEAETPPETVTVTSSITETLTTTKTETTEVEPTTEESTTTEATTEPADVHIDPDTNPAANVDVDKPRRVASIPEPAPAPAPVQSQAPAPAPAPAPASTYYKNCSAARAAGAAPVYAGNPGYGKHLDRNGDGVGCE